LRREGIAPLPGRFTPGEKNRTCWTRGVLALEMLLEKYTYPKSWRVQHPSCFSNFICRQISTRDAASLCNILRIYIHACISAFEILKHCFVASSYPRAMKLLELILTFDYLFADLLVYVGMCYI